MGDFDRWDKNNTRGYANKSVSSPSKMKFSENQIRELASHFGITVGEMKDKIHMYGEDAVLDALFYKNPKLIKL